MDDSPSNSRPHRPDRRAFLTAEAAVGVAGCTDVLGEGETETADWHEPAAAREDLGARATGYDEHVGDRVRVCARTGEYDSEATTAFTGAFDGRGNEIADLRVDRPETDSVGCSEPAEARPRTCDSPTPGLPARVASATSSTAAMRPRRSCAGLPSPARRRGPRNTG